MKLSTALFLATTVGVTAAFQSPSLSRTVRSIHNTNQQKKSNVGGGAVKSSSAMWAATMDGTANDVDVAGGVAGRRKKTKQVSFVCFG